MSNDEKHTVQVTQKGTELVFTDAKGVEHKYRQPIRTLKVEALSLFLADNYGTADVEGDMQPSPTRVINGVGRIDDGPLSVIGDPERSTNTVSLSIRPRTAVKHRELVAKQSGQTKDADTADVPNTAADVILGFNAGDWEIGNDDDWWLAVDVSEEVFSSLVSGIQRQQVAQLSIGVRLNNIFTDEYYAPPSMRVKWFLRPAKKDGDTKWPEIAHGAINWLSARGHEIKFGETARPTGEADDDEVQAPTAPPPFAAAAEGLDRATAAITASISSLRTTIVRAAWIVAGALVIVALF